MSEFQKPWAISREELDLRWDYGEGKMPLKEFNRRLKKIKQKEKRGKRN